MTTALIVFACILLLSIIAAGCYYAAYRFVDLRHNRNVIADELKRATDHIGDLESRVMMLEAERDSELARLANLHKRPSDGYGVFDIRS